MKDNIINFIKHHYKTGAILVLLVLSFGTNVYFWNWKKPLNAPVETQPVTLENSTTAPTVVESPYGFRSEVTTVYDGKQAKTYTKTVPITQDDVKEMKNSIIRQQQLMDDYFRKQDELFRSLWRSF